MTNQIKHVEAEDGLKTYVTKNYGQFTILEDNRMINQNHVIRLIDATQEYPEGLKFEPIMINERGEVIDGQHRLEAVKRLGFWVYYQIGKGLDINDTIRMNVYRRNWTPLDYAYTYSARGKQDYSRYIEFHERYPDLQHRALMAYMQSGETNRAGILFNEGKFVAPDEDGSIANRINQYEDMVKHLPRRDFATSRAFQRAVLTIITHKSYDHERMMAKMDYAATKYLMHPFEGLYNENARVNDRVRFE